MSFGQEVRRRRKRAKITQDELAERLNVVRSYVSQVETGATQCRADFAARIDVALDTGDEIRSAWREFIEPLQEEKYPTFFANFPRAEQNATMIRAYEYNVVYGLLQTKEYASALLRDEKDVANRLARQAVMRRDDPPLVCVVMSEAVLYTLVGSPETMREQLEYLIEASFEERVFIQIAPFIHYRGVWGSFHIATQPDRKEIAYADIAFGGETTSDPVRVRRASDAFATLQAQAHNETTSREVIRKVISERWT
ncbi:helix-turn-helix domain-containing protein [Actinomadura kijaniata]|uniref:helix-turn-helix domain-containing protein n=1 Tax=Actinomadura kijaniata TaxID=46161 RepID=UPI003F1BD213